MKPQRPMGSKDPRTRLFSALATLASARPRLVLALLGVLVLLGVGAGSQLEINTSRFEIVDANDPYQSRLLGFHARFGQPDAPLLLVEGGDARQRQEVVDRLVLALEADPAFEGRVLGRISAETIAEFLLVHRPELLGQLRSGDQDANDLPTLIEGGLPAFLGTLNAQLQAGLDGDDQAANMDGSAQNLQGLGLLATRLEAQLNPASQPPSMTAQLGTSPPPGVDARGYLVGRKGEHHMVLVFPDFPGSQVSDYQPIVQAIRKIRDQTLQEIADMDTGTLGSIDVLLTGLPVLTSDEQGSISDALWKTTVATGTGIFVLLMLAFRSLRQSLIVLIPLGPGMAITVGAVYLIYGHLNPLTAGFFAILLGLGIDFSVHLTARFHENLRNGEDRQSAIRRALVLAGPGILTGALTSATAFLTVLSADFTAFGELGVNSAVGLALVFLVTMLLLPILLAKTKMPAGAPPVFPGIGRLPTLLRRAPRRILSVAVLTATLSLIGLGGLSFNTRYLDFLPAAFESSRALNTLEEDGALSPMFAFASAESFEDARELAAQLRGLDSVAEVHTPTDLGPELDEARRAALRTLFADVDRDPNFDALAGVKASAAALAGQARDIADALDEIAFALDDRSDEDAQGPAAAAREAARHFSRLEATLRALPNDGDTALTSLHRDLAELLSRAWTTARDIDARGRYSTADLPRALYVRHAAKDDSEAIALYVFPKTRVWEESAAKRFVSDVESVDPDAAGMAFSIHIHSNMIIHDFLRAALISALLVFGIMYWDFRNLRDAALAMAPVFLGAAWMVGLMAATGLRFDAANIVVLPVIFGLGIDAGVHTLHRCRQSQAQYGIARLEDLVTGTGSAVLVASLTTMVGFLGLLAAEYGGTQSLGTLMVLGVGCSMLASIVVLPTLLVVLGRVR